MFGYDIDKRSIYIAIAIIAVISILSMTKAEMLGLLFSIPGVLIAITFHEYAHAITAVKLGDETPRNQGRLSLNPLSHMDPIGIVLLLFCGFGWGKPVQTNPARYNRNMTMEKGEAIVAFAGPAMNFMLAIIFTFIYAISFKYASATFLLSTAGNIVFGILEYTIYINIGLGVFNLIPLPPLDGSKILKNFLPYNTRRKFEESEMIFYIVFLGLWLSGLAGRLISPAIRYLAKTVMELVFKIVF
jgi:Zn-dependent protease